MGCVWLFGGIAEKHKYLEHAGIRYHHIKTENHYGQNKLHRVVGENCEEIHFYEFTYGISRNLTALVSFSAN